jgi:iron complex transport system substrate-binding protein
VPARLVAAVVLASLALLAAGCGGDGDGAPSAGADPAATTPVDMPAGLPDGRGAVRTNADGTRTVTSSWGTAVVPAEPRRIVSVLGYIDLESMLALGVTPVAAGTQGGTVASGFAPHLEGLVDGVERLAWVDGAPVERIAALRPDLIFAPDADSAELLSGIAPTVPAGAVVEDWKGDLRYIAAVLGLDEGADRLLEEYERDAADLRDRLEPLLAGRTVASPQVAYDHSQVYIDGADAFSSQVLTELGMTLAPMVTGATADPIAVSFERLPEIDADILFWQVRQKDEDGSRDTAGLTLASRSALWDRIPAVEAGTVFEVDNRPWYFSTILAARRMLEDVERALL